MSTPVLVLNNLRIVVVVIVVAVHAVMACLGSSPASSFKFDDPPYRWRSMPIVDPGRWFGFDFSCGFQDIYLISLLFFLSGLFVWPSLARSGSRIFLRERVSVESYTENPTWWPSRFPSCFSPKIRVHNGGDHEARRHLSRGLNGFPDHREPAVGVLRSSRNHFSIASSLAKTLRWVDVADFLACVDVDSDGFHRITAEGQDGHSLPSQFSLLLNLSQAFRQAFKLRTDLHFHRVL
jgi:hypothetical protein